MSRVAFYACLATLLLACGGERPLEPLPAPDRITLGQLGKNESGGEITDAAAVQRALDFSNRLRQGAWSTRKVEHGACGTVLMTFRAKSQTVGYLALEGDRFFTNAPGGEVMLAAPSATVQEFLGLLPRWYVRSHCMG